jgi:hypothetical protein
MMVEDFISYDDGGRGGGTFLAEEGIEGEMKDGGYF